MKISQKVHRIEDGRIYLTFWTNNRQVVYIFRNKYKVFPSEAWIAKNISYNGKIYSDGEHEFRNIIIPKQSSKLSIILPGTILDYTSRPITIDLPLSMVEMYCSPDTESYRLGHYLIMENLKNRYGKVK